MFFCLSVFQPCAFAQDSEIELDMDRAVDLALKNNLNLKKTQIDLSASGYSEKHIWSEIFPTINGSARADYSNPLLSSQTTQNDGMSYSIGVGVNLGLNAGIPYSMKSIKLAHQSNILRYEDACNQLAIQTIKLFCSLITEKNNLSYLQEIMDLAERQYERDRISFNNGLIRELTMIQSRLAAQNARFNLSAASSSYANNMGEFLAMLGMAQDADVTLLGEVTIVRIEADAEALINQHLSKRPDIARSLQEMQRLEYAEKQSEMQTRSPSLTLSLDWNASKIDPFTDRIRGSAALTIPIDSWIPGTNRSQTVRRAGDSVEKAKLDLQITEDAAKTQIRSLTSALRNSWDSIEIARLSLEVAIHSYNLTEQGFRNGIVEYLVLEDARNNMSNARQRLLQSELAYFNMILDLSASLNVDWKNIIQTVGVSSEEE